MSPGCALFPLRTLASRLDPPLRTLASRLDPPGRDFSARRATPLLSLAPAPVLQMPFFNNVRVGFLQLLVGQMQMQVCLSYEQVIVAGTIGREMYFVSHGTTRVTARPDRKRMGAEGRERGQATRGEGEIGRGSVTAPSSLCYPQTHAHCTVPCASSGHMNAVPVNAVPCTASDPMEERPLFPHPSPHPPSLPRSAPRPPIATACSVY